MNKILIIIALLTGGFVAAQQKEFINDLKKDKANEIFIFRDECSSCISIKTPCDAYLENSAIDYILWRNKKGYHIKKFNVCGSSKTITFRKWDNNPFDLIKNKSIELDTTKLLYPLSLSQKDSTWFETGINHYKVYTFSFLTFKIKDLQVKDYAFQEFFSSEIENDKNLPRSKFNNDSAVKELLDIVEGKIFKVRKKLKIK